MPNFLSMFQDPKDFLAVAPEDLGGVVIELAPSFMQNEMFTIDHILSQLYPNVGPTYPPPTKVSISRAVAEAISWLVTQGLLIVDPIQPSLWYRLTRRAANLHTRADVEAFRKGRILPDDLLPTIFLQKVVHLFRRGDYDVAVFQAFKEVEVAVRTAANEKGAGYPNSDVGTALMRKAFHPETGPLTDTDSVPAEREAVMHLFSASIGYAKNPTSHRHVVISAVEAARLIIFASHLLDIVEDRAK